jgi:3-hydroxy acid dehydrogenase / malonic semialdehyde reductase
MKTALITGASSGFGSAIAKLFAQHGYRLILMARRAERLAQLKEVIQKNSNAEVLVLYCDVRDQLQVNNQLDTLPSDWRHIDVLVNNAGLARGKALVQDLSFVHMNEMIDTNVKGLLHVTHKIVQWMIPLRSGMIINIGSIAGKEAYVGGNAYSASKFAVDALTKSMRIDLLPHQIRVGQIAPGAANTEFSTVRFDGNVDIVDAVYKGFSPLLAEDIAEAALFMATRPAHVCINDMVIMPTAQANATTFYKATNG